jgi:sugar/nucleoside kinase (ribokinase family)
MIHVDRLPEGRGATIHPRWHHEAIGGAGAGKAMNLARLGVDVTLFAGIGQDDAGRRVRQGLAAAGVDLHATDDPTGTPEHINLMDPAGGRVSIMLANGSPDLPVDEPPLAESMARADVVVVDLAPWTPRALPVASSSGRPIWTDLHDHDGTSSWHAPFIEAAEVVFVSHDRLPDPRAFLTSLIERGKQFATCTMGAEGAIAIDADGRWYEQPAVPDVTVVDSNGAGDAFFAGTLFGVLEGVALEVALGYGARAAALSVSSTELASPDLTADRVRSDLI